MKQHYAAESTKAQGSAAMVLIASSAYIYEHAKGGGRREREEAQQTLPATRLRKADVRAGETTRND